MMTRWSLLVRIAYCIACYILWCGVGAKGRKRASEPALRRDRRARYYSMSDSSGNGNDNGIGRGGNEKRRKKGKGVDSRTRTVGKVEEGR